MAARQGDPMQDGWWDRGNRLKAQYISTVLARQGLHRHGPSARGVMERTVEAG